MGAATICRSTGSLLQAGRTSAIAWEMDTLVDDGVELARVGGDHAADGEPVGDAAGTTRDTLPGDAGLDIGVVDAGLDEPLGEQIGRFTVTKVAGRQQPQLRDVQFAGVVDRDSGPVVELVHVSCHSHHVAPRAPSSSDAAKRRRRRAHMLMR